MALINPMITNWSVVTLNGLKNIVFCDSMERPLNPHAKEERIPLVICISDRYSLNSFNPPEISRRACRNAERIPPDVNIKELMISESTPKKTRHPPIPRTDIAHT